jgi:hypothetical protein
MKFIYRLLAWLSCSFAVGDVCPPALRARNYVSGPQIFFLHNKFPTVGGAQFDVQFNLPYPCNSFFLVSTSQPTDTLFLSLKPTGRNNPGGVLAAIVPLGTEEWFQMTAVPASGPNYFGMFRFKEPIQTIFLSAGTESGNASTITLACVADDALIVTGGVYT